MAQATLGGGCFWCIEAAFKDIQGVERVVSGYAGGTVADPTYEQVCSGRTGHAEVTQITFDESEIMFPELLEIFFTVHDPTTKDRQGGDVGTQYRSVVFSHDEAQQEQALIAIADAQGHWERPIVTEVTPLVKFWPAEDYHQDYYARNTTQGYCAAVISPKLAKLRSKWAHRLKP